MNLQKLFWLVVFGVLLLTKPGPGEVSTFLPSKKNDLNLGQKFPKRSLWFGNQVVSSSLPILIFTHLSDSEVKK